MDLSKYYTEICKQPMLKKAEEASLFCKYEDPSTPEKEKTIIRDRIINSNLRFVFNQAKKFSKNDPTTFEELILAGNEGLIIGFNKFNPASGVRFLTYAGWWVNQSILKEMSKMRIVSLPIWKQQLAARIANFCENKEHITVEDLYAEFPDVDKKYISELYSRKYLTFYIEDLSETQEESFLISPIEEEVEVRLDNEKVWKAVAQLPSPQREVITKSFGLDDFDDQSIIKISRSLKMPREDVIKYRLDGLSRLKGLLKV